MGRGRSDEGHELREFRFMGARYKVSDYVTALQQTNGLIFQAAERLGCTPQAIYKAVKRHEEVREALETERGKFVDLGEQKLYEAVMDREPWAVALVLKTLGKHRGYVERQELKLTQQEALHEIAQMLGMPNGHHADV